jgi:hypothetical protein
MGESGSDVTFGCEHPFVGYRGKVGEREAARALRARGWTMNAIAAKLGVSKSSVSLWTRDVPFEARRRQYRPGSRSTHRQHVEKVREIEELRVWAADRLGAIGEDAFFTAGIALYAGEGTKTGGQVRFTNSDPRMVGFFCVWLRRFFDIDETKLRLRLYLHEGLDLDAAREFWTGITDIPPDRFLKPYRAVADATTRHTKHEHGCASVAYYSTRVHRVIMALVGALLSSSSPHSGVAQLAEHRTANQRVLGSSPSPGARPEGP